MVFWYYAELYSDHVYDNDVFTKYEAPLAQRTTTYDNNK